MSDGTSPEQFGPYLLHRLVGRGGMGEVWSAYDRQRERTVALKRLTSDWADDQEFQARFRREARLTANLTSVHVIPIHDFGEIDGRLFVDMRLVGGGDLASALRNAPHGFAPERALEIVTQLASALDAAHRQGLVHRDVKPSNVLLEPDGHRDFVYLTDFGIAKIAEESSVARLTGTGAALGTPAYMAPELFTGTGGASMASDVYALGCVLFEMLCGRSPYPGPTPGAFMHQHVYFPPPAASAYGGATLRTFDPVLARALAKDPAIRFPTAPELAGAAQAAAGQVHTGAVIVPSGPGPRPPATYPTPVPHPSGPLTSWPPAPGPSTDGRAGRRRTRTRLLVALGTVLVLAAATAGILAAVRNASAPPSAAAPAPPFAVPTALSNPSGLTISQDGSRIYVTNDDPTQGGTLTSVDTGTLQAVATMSIPSHPENVAVSPDGRTAWIAASGGPLSVVDTATSTIIATVTLPTNPYHVALSPDGARAYVTLGTGTADRPAGALAVVDTATRAVTAMIPLGAGPLAPAVSRNGRFVLVPEAGVQATGSGTTVAVIDAVTNKLVRRISTGYAPQAAAFLTDSRAYVAASGATTDPYGMLQLTDIVSGATTDFPTGAFPSPNDLALSPDGRTLVVSTYGLVTGTTGAVVTLDTATGTVRRSITLPTHCGALALAPDGRHAFVSTYRPAGLWLVDVG